MHFQARGRRLKAVEKGRTITKYCSLILPGNPDIDGSPHFKAQLDSELDGYAVLCNLVKHAKRELGLLNSATD
jgi:hypothetical protein